MLSPQAPSSGPSRVFRRLSGRSLCRGALPSASVLDQGPYYQNQSATRPLDDTGSLELFHVRIQEETFYRHRCLLEAAILAPPSGHQSTVVWESPHRRLLAYPLKPPGVAQIPDIRYRLGALTGLSLSIN